jgi:hypothetical protein
MLLGCGVGGANSSTVSDLLIERDRSNRPVWTIGSTVTQAIANIAKQAAVNNYHVADATRDTTAQEHIIGEFRKFKLLAAGWDGEGAVAPVGKSLDEAVRLTRLLRPNVIAEPMLFANGRAGLFWRDNGLYGDLEFLGDGRIAYFIERNGDKHKGVVNFDAKEMPALFKALLPT